jgi:RNA polymerase sigma factor (sigma-70 family)
MMTGGEDSLFGTTSTERNTALSQLALDDCLERIAMGDKNSLAELFEMTKAPVYGFALSIVKNAHDAEDVLQECYVKIWNAAENYISQGKPMAWILTIVRNLSTSLLRERSKSSELPSDDWHEHLADYPSVSTDDRLVLEAAMERLGDDERQIVMLHAVSGLKHIEIAGLMTLPLSTVLSKYNRAKKKLRKTLMEGE